jgi:putative membrane protein insertion efficiency factor
MKDILLGIIRVYQLTLSAFIGRRCRYLPTCSEYTSDAIRKHGAGRGTAMGFARICRCHPWGQSGFDPVPDVYEGPVWRMTEEQMSSPASPAGEDESLDRAPPLP